MNTQLRVTPRQLENMAGDICELALDLGWYDSDRYHLLLNQASPVYGVPWKLMLRDHEDGSLIPFHGLPDGVLGMSKKEARDTLAVVRDMLRHTKELRNDEQ